MNNPIAAPANFFVVPESSSSVGYPMPNSFPTTTFGSNNPDQWKTETQVKLEEAKKQMLDKKRIYDVFFPWGTQIDEQINRYRTIVEQTNKSEIVQYDILQNTLHLKKQADLIENTQGKINDHLEILLSEQNDLNRALDALEAHLEHLIQESFPRGLGIEEDRNNLYDKASACQKHILGTETILYDFVKQLNEMQGKENGDIEMSLDAFLDTLDWIQQQMSVINDTVQRIESSQSSLFQSYFNR